MSLFGGSQPSGNTTTTTVNPTSQAQLPYLTGAWNQAQNLAGSNPITYYPGQTLATYNPGVLQGYNALYNQAVGPMAGVGASGANAFNSAAGGGMGIYNSPAYNAFNAAASGTYGDQGSLGNLTNSAAITGYNALGTVSPYMSAAMSNPATSMLANTASGAYLSPNSNPYLAGMFNAAAQPVINQYMTATAPQTDSAMEAAGRYGSGALANAQSVNEQNLGTTLGNMASNIYGNNYENALGITANAQNALGNLSLNQALGAGGLANAATNAATNAYGTAGSIGSGLLNSELQGASGLESGYEAGNQNALRALLMEPQVQQGLATPSETETQAGAGVTSMGQSLINDAMNRFYGTQLAPYQTLQTELSEFGQPVLGSSATTSPYFQNQGANALGMGLGGLGLYNGLTSAGLLGGSSAVAPAALGIMGLPAGTGLSTFLDSVMAAAL